MSINLTIPTLGTSARNGSSVLARAARNPALRTAIEAQAPDYLDLDHQLELLIASTRDLTPLERDDHLAQTLRESLAQGRGVPADLLTTVANTPDPAAITQRAAVILHDIATDLVIRRDEAFTRRSTALFGHLEQQLTTLLAAAQKLADAPTDPEEAIASGRTEQYEQARALERDYEHLRAAQRVLTRATWHDHSPTTPQARILSYIGTPAQAWPDLATWLATGYRTDNDGSRWPLTPPWPDLNTPPSLWWLATHPEATPWVPTRDRYDAAVHSLDLATSAAASRARR